MAVLSTMVAIHLKVYGSALMFWTGKEKEVKGAQCKGTHEICVSRSFRGFIVVRIFNISRFAFKPRICQQYMITVFACQVKSQ